MDINFLKEVDQQLDDMRSIIQSNSVISFEMLVQKRELEFWRNKLIEEMF